MAEDNQHLKKAAALAYDYDRDERWSEYWSNVLIPENRSKSDVERYFKFKFYQRNIDPGLKVEPLTSQSSTTTTSRSSNQRTTPAGERSSTSTGTSHANTRGYAGSNGFKLDQFSAGFLLNALVIIMAAFAVLPFIPQSLSGRSYRFTFLGSIMAYGLSIYLQFGRPRTLDMRALQTWLQSVLAGKDFLYLFYSLVFISTLMPLKFATLPVACHSLLNVGQYLKRNFNNTQTYRNFLEKPCRWLEANSMILRTLSTNCEIGLGFLLILLLLAPQKNFIQVVIYWQLLKLMYHAPLTASSHRGTWSKIGQKVNPLIHQYASFLESPLQFAQRWFQN